GDVNADGHLDLVAPGYDPRTFNSGVVWSLGDGAGGFAPLTAAVYVNGVAALALVDADKDGNVDVLALSRAAGRANERLMFFKGTPAGPIVPAQLAPSRAAWQLSLGLDPIADWVSAAELDGDGAPDVLISGVAWDDFTGQVTNTATEVQTGSPGLHWGPL